MLLSKRSQFLALMLVVSHGWVGANESNKQPPLELPKMLADGEPVVTVENTKPDPVKKGAPKSEAVTSRDVKSVNLPPAKSEASAPAKPAAKAPSAPARDLSGLPEMGNYITRKGDTVEKILQKFYPASPLRADVLRDALVQNNPTAFPKGSAKSLVIGSNLSLPDPLELSRKLLMPAMAPVASKNDSPASVPPPAMAVAAAAPVSTPAQPAGGGGAAAHSAGHNMALQDPKRHWVRYP
jgi:Tfp pilus assembly protein FimV